MKNLATILTTLGMMLALATPASADQHDEHPTDTVCLTYPPAVIGCATGTIGNLAPTNCNADGCWVTLTGDLSVTPVACGWLEQGDLRACALSPTDIPATAHGIDPQFFSPGGHRMESDLCISDPTLTVTVPCVGLVHYFVVPSASMNSEIGDLPPIDVDEVLSLPSRLLSDPEGTLVYASQTFRVYKLSDSLR